jgi:hypothetical protein
LGEVAVVIGVVVVDVGTGGCVSRDVVVIGVVVICRGVDDFEEEHPLRNKKKALATTAIRMRTPITLAVLTPAICWGVVASSS